MRKPTTIFWGIWVVVAGCAMGQPSVKTLSRQLRSRKAVVRVRALAAVPSYGVAGESLIPAVVENFRDRREPVSRAAQKTLLSLKAKGVGALAGLLSDRDSWVRCRAAVSLGEIPADAVEAIPALVGGLGDSDFCVSDKSALALGRMGEPAVPALITALNSTQPMMWQGAARALGMMPASVHQRVVSERLPRLLTKDEFARGAEAMRVTHMGAIGIPIFLAALKENDADLRQRAVDGLGEIGLPTPEVAESLIGLFSDPQPTLRLKAAVVLGHLGQRDSAVYRRVATGLDSVNKAVLLGTLRALGDMGGAAEDSVPRMKRLMEDSGDADIRNEAAESLIKMGTHLSREAAEKYMFQQYRRGSSK